jgi:outer membrane murein-binding lipoprotein Lpp
MKFGRFFPAVEVIKPRGHGSHGKVAVGAVLAGVTLLGGGVEMADVASASTVAPRIALRPAQIAALDGLVADRLNVIRASFGLTTGQATTSYTVEVTKAVMSNEDPPFAPATGGVIAEGSLWGVVPGASGSSASSALEIVNGWVYHDGWEGSVQATWNADCTSAYAAGCEGHRRDVLTTPPTPGAKLYIDVATRSVSFDGSPALAVAALLVWKTDSVVS